MASSVTSGYKPIAQRVVVGNNQEKRIVRVMDLFSLDHQEFLAAEDAGTGEKLVVRLDSVVSITDLSTHTTCSRNVL
jgi:hypothetical protein